MASARLTHEGIASAPLEAQMLAAHRLQIDRTFVLAHPELEIDEKTMESVLDRRANHEPLAYILGWREFFGRTFQVDPRVLIPRQETEILVETVLFRFEDEPLRVLDIGAGSGAIAITLSLERPTWDIEGIDVSSDALDVAKDNARQLGASVTLYQADLFPEPEGKYDLIISNPPYVGIHDDIGTDVRSEPAIALFAGLDGLEIYEQIALRGRAHLRAGGEIWLEIGRGQAGRVKSIFATHGWEPLAEEQDLAGIVRVVGFRIVVPE